MVNLPLLARLLLATFVSSVTAAVATPPICATLLIPVMEGIFPAAVAASTSARIASWPGGKRIFGISVPFNS